MVSQPWVDTIDANLIVIPPKTTLTVQQIMQRCNVDEATAESIKQDSVDGYETTIVPSVSELSVEQITRFHSVDELTAEAMQARSRGEYVGCTPEHELSYTIAGPLPEPK